MEQLDSAASGVFSLSSYYASEYEPAVLTDGEILEWLRNDPHSNWEFFDKEDAYYQKYYHPDCLECDTPAIAEVPGESWVESEDYTAPFPLCCKHLVAHEKEHVQRHIGYARWKQGKEKA